MLLSQGNGVNQDQPLFSRLWSNGFLPSSHQGVRFRPGTCRFGLDSRKPGTYAANGLMARRLAERNVRFIQLYRRGWDQHADLPRDLALQCKGTDQASAALVNDLKQRGLLDDTLLVWGGIIIRAALPSGWRAEGGWRAGHQARESDWGNRRLLLQRGHRSGAGA